jgi:hypothetical protein
MEKTVEAGGDESMLEERGEGLRGGYCSGPWEAGITMSS